ncbi:MAG TPA: hypothetical protein VFC00_06115 [Micromonosporaceae bacterium]|nr:hypothetical protein [Micromonosporaceae bacterium]
MRRREAPVRLAAFTAVAGSVQRTPGVRVGNPGRRYADVGREHAQAIARRCRTS